MTEDKNADSGEWQSIASMISEAQECFAREVAKDRPFDVAFNNATQGFVTDLSLLRDLVDAKDEAARLEAVKADGVQSFSAKMIADSIPEVVRFESQTEQYRADLSRCSRRIALMLAKLFPHEGIIASLTASHDSAVARIAYLTECEAALRELVRSLGEHPISFHEDVAKALDSAVATLHYDSPAQ